MPRKRPAAVRMAELEDKMDSVKLEMEIARLREKRASKRPRRRRRMVRN